MFERSPIPQWFRLKTDTKIQVRCLAFSWQRKSVSEADIDRECSTTPNAVTGDARN